MASNSSYLLRPNKTVDRLLFFDLLKRLDVVFDFAKSYSYLGMGGTYLEDFRLMHEVFPRMGMICLEEKEHLSQRQKFNKPHSAIRFVTQSVEAWIDGNLPSSKPYIVWLDFQGKQRREQISQFQSLLLGAVKPLIVRITLDVSPDTLGGNTTQSEKFERLKAQLGSLMDKKMTVDTFSQLGLAVVIRDVVLQAARKSLENQKGNRFFPLSISSYRDTSQMLSITGMVAAREFGAEVEERCGLSNWDYYWPQNEIILNINLPELSVRERMFLNQRLPRNADNVNLIHKSFGFLLDEDERLSRSLLDSYIRFAKHYPQFARVAF